MVSKQNGSGRIYAAVKSYAKPQHSHLDTILNGAGASTLLPLGLKYLPSNLPDLFTLHGLIGIAGVVIGAVGFIRIFLNELTHLKL